MQRILIVLTLILALEFYLGAAEIHNAAENGDLESVKKLVSADPKLVDTPDREGKTPLHYAAAKGHLNVVKWLVQKGANVNARNSSGITPLYLAKGFGKKDIVQFLEQHGGTAEIVKPQRQITKTPITGIRSPSTIVSPIRTSVVPIIEAVKTTNIEQIVAILKVAPDSVNARNPSQFTPLHFAAELGSLEVAKFLIENGADVNANGENGSTPLHQAVLKHNTNIVTLLISKKADVNAQTTAKITPLMLACGIAYDYEIARILIESGADVNIKDQFGNTALSFAASYPDESKLSQLLIKSGADVNVRDLITGFTPLHHAALRDNATVAQMLIKAGANVNAATTENDTPLLIARFEHATKVENVLLQNGGKEPQYRKLTEIEQSLINYYRKYYETILKGDASEIRKHILLNRPLKADVDRVFLKNADVAWELIQKTSRDEDVAWASVAKNPDIKTQMVEILRGDARPGDYYILLTDAMSNAVRLAKERGFISKDVPVLSLKIRRRGETTLVGEYYFVNNKWMQMPPLNMVFPDLR